MFWNKWWIDDDNLLIDTQAKEKIILKTLCQDIEDIVLSDEFMKWVNIVLDKTELKWKDDYMKKIFEKIEKCEEKLEKEEKETLKLFLNHPDVKKIIIRILIQLRWLWVKNIERKTLEEDIIFWELFKKLTSGKKWYRMIRRGVLKEVGYIFWLWKLIF